ncbi:hypothetical protein K438DRAFT_1975141 [Mycena galopus ATCC 62051]|nr:hypothetical protein K438DRAFT_1975141 [Mycena galopus ATCC 62051]
MKKRVSENDGNPIEHGDAPAQRPKPKPLFRTKTTAAPAPADEGPTHDRLPDRTSSSPPPIAGASGASKTAASDAGSTTTTHTGGQRPNTVRGSGKGGGPPGVKLRPVLLHKLPEDVLCGLLKVVAAGVFGEVAAKGDLWEEEELSRRPPPPAVAQPAREHANSALEHTGFASRVTSTCFRPIAAAPPTFGQEIAQTRRGSEPARKHEACFVSFRLHRHSARRRSSTTTRIGSETPSFLLLGPDASDNPTAPPQPTTSRAVNCLSAANLAAGVRHDNDRVRQSHYPAWRHLAPLAASPSRAVSGLRSPPSTAAPRSPPLPSPHLSSPSPSPPFLPPPRLTNETDAHPREPRSTSARLNGGLAPRSVPARRALLSSSLLEETCPVSSRLLASAPATPSHTREHPFCGAPSSSWALCRFQDPVRPSTRRASTMTARLELVIVLLALAMKVPSTSVWVSSLRLLPPESIPPRLRLALPTPPLHRARRECGLAAQPSSPIRIQAAEGRLDERRVPSPSLSFLKPAAPHRILLGTLPSTPAPAPCQCPPSPVPG